ncbi:hypothetical protein N658DRAFT_359146 [Parathielavia hyrcaniae]|uniref:Uncharacterized protein n=1 Tax=Parathielavia hyrcaniae TaxID=113614 RepID=A0AAN6T348_9PEZI|nr:hypothetical protein N658DRAFT_359146 [Parathielavia hyrcaniae]
MVRLLTLALPALVAAANFHRDTNQPTNNLTLAEPPTYRGIHDTPKDTPSPLPLLPATTTTTADPNPDPNLAPAKDNPRAALDSRRQQQRQRQRHSPARLLQAAAVLLRPAERDRDRRD